nr:sugar carrier protein A-like [Ipomoea batatas]
MLLFVFSLSSSAYYKSNLAAKSNFCRFTGSLVFMVHLLVLIGTFMGLILAKRLSGLNLIIGPVLVASGAAVCANFPHLVVHGVMYFMTGLGDGNIREVIPIWLLQIAPEGERDRLDFLLTFRTGNAHPCSIRATPVQRMCKVDGLTENASRSQIDLILSRHDPTVLVLSRSEMLEIACPSPDIDHRARHSSRREQMPLKSA